MSLPAFLRRLTTALDTGEVPYMVCGSVASFVHGMPRTTQDVDVVVALTQAVLPGLLAQFPEDEFYVSADAARAAVRAIRQFNIIDMRTGWKADLIVQKPRPFSRGEFERRVRLEAMGVPVWLASAEDTILAKLEWGQAGRSERQLGDARGIVAVQGARLDCAYLKRWALELGVADELEGLLHPGAAP